MKSIQDRRGEALLVIDVQVGVVATSYQRDAVVATIAGLVEKARAAGTPIVWVQHSDQELAIGGAKWQIVPELVPASGDAVVHKRFGDSFEETDLEQVLAGRGVSTLWITGAQTDACIRSTLHGALVRGYNTWLVTDAHTTDDLSAWGAPTPELVIAHTNMYWEYQTAPGRTAGTKEASDVVFQGVRQGAGS